jgi:cytochrome c oxidase assembly protein subunit 11
MILLSFASVPLYRAFCQVTGFGGTTQVAQAVPNKISDRVITVQFNADIASDLPWDFHPEQRTVDVRLGEKALVSFLAENQTAQASTGTALYNVTPPKVGQYFKKIECFCFGLQTLEPQQKAHMPVVFFLDPALVDDPNMNDVQTVTLSYTFYKAESKELETAMERFYKEK